MEDLQLESSNHLFRSKAVISVDRHCQFLDLSQNIRETHCTCCILYFNAGCVKNYKCGLFGEYFGEISSQKFQCQTAVFEKSAKTPMITYIYALSRKEKHLLALEMTAN